jgi:hypothetical protein
MGMKRLVKTFAVGSVLAAGIVGVATPAQAALADCDRGSACVWRDNNYGGVLQEEFAYHAPSNDTGSSIDNNGYCGYLSVAYFYDRGDYQGDYRRLTCYGYGQSRDPYLTNGVDEDTRFFDNKISSASFGN